MYLWIYIIFNLPIYMKVTNNLESKKKIDGQTNHRENEALTNF